MVKSLIALSLLVICGLAISLDYVAGWPSCPTEIDYTDDNIKVSEEASTAREIAAQHRRLDRNDYVELMDSLAL